MGIIYVNFIRRDKKMSEQCTHDCSSCGEDCASRTKESLIEKPNDLSSINKVIAVVSGKGGVGKSTVTSAMSVLMSRKGYRTAVLDADITGPSIPKAFGITEKARGNEYGIFPAITDTGIQAMSINLLLENDTDPVVWRGPVISGTVKQFWTDVIWDNVDYMFIDMPPGTGDVALTVFQSVPVDGIIIVTSPQQLVEMIVEKAVKMAQMMNIPILGIVENMSYFECPNCNKKHSIFGESHIDDIAKRLNIDTVSKLPVNADIATLSDSGLIEHITCTELDNMADKIEKLSK